jgi:hypothetical protein
VNSFTRIAHAFSLTVASSLLPKVKDTMLRRWSQILILGLLFMLLGACNLPGAVSPSLSEGESGVVPCDVDTLITAFGTQEEMTLSPGCTYIFTDAYVNDINYGPLALPAITSEKTIHGNGATLVRSPAPESDPGTFRFMFIGEGADVLIENLNFENGGWGGSFEECPNKSSCGNGGAISISNSSLLLSNTSFFGNGAFNGGAISNAGNLEIENSIFEDNRSRSGGAIVTWGTGSTLIRTSNLRENYANGHGGALESVGSTSIYSSILERNTATDHGGAIYIGEAGNVHIMQSAIIYNWGQISGAVSSKGNLVIENSTIAHNFSARGGLPGYASIGAVDSMWSLVIRYSTIANNSGGGTAVSSTNNASVIISNTIIANTERSDCSILVPIEMEAGVNLSTDDSCLGFMLIDDPLLGPLADNGGYAPTMELDPNSPAVDAASGGCPETDQRGVVRPEGDGCDLGSYEFGLKEVGGLPPLIPEIAEAIPERQELSAEPYLPEDEPSKPSHTGRIEEAVPCFNGPGPMYAVVSSLQPGALVEIIGISENGDYIVILNPCYPGVPCWAEEGSIEIHDQLDPNRIIPDPPKPEEPKEEGSSADSPVCEPYSGEAECIAAGGTYNISSPPPCTCPP